MTSKQFFYFSIGVSFFLVASIALCNISANEYGLFGDAKGKSISIYHNERTTKYLLSYNYIPSNFEGIILGPSFSNNLNTKKIKDYKIYNASLDGGNISELKLIAENIINRGNIKFIIFCLNQYLTKNHGRKTSYMYPNEYWTSMYSTGSIQLKIIKYLTSKGYNKERYNSHGYHNFNIEKSNLDSRKLIQEYAAGISLEKGIINSIALDELKYVVHLARQNNIMIFGYFHPYHQDVYSKIENRLREYEQTITGIFSPDDVVWSFNTDAYLDFRKDYAHYCDRDHLSDKGADFIMNEILIRLKENVRADRPKQRETRHSL